jgi:hypothetical protein
VHNLLRFDGMFISRRFNVLSFRVGLSAFKNDIINSIESNIPHKLFTYKKRLPWINNNLRKLINKKNKYHRKKNQNPSMYKKLKHTVQKEQRKAYWKYIENIIFDLPISFFHIFSVGKRAMKNTMRLYFTWIIV